MDCNGDAGGFEVLRLRAPPIAQDDEGLERAVLGCHW